MGLSLDYGFILKVNSKVLKEKVHVLEVTISGKQKRTVHVGMFSASADVAGSPCHVTS